MKKYYVTMTDKFLSGWGLAKNKISKIVIECDTLEEAQIVKENALNRSDMINVRICTRKPKYDEQHYVVAYETKETYPNWFIKDYFKNRKEEQ